MTASVSPPLVLSPATPSELLSHVITNYSYPTTIIVGCSKQAFLTALTNDVIYRLHQETSADETPSQDNSLIPSHPLLKTPLSQIAISRHIRILFAPTVTHLRAQLAVFSPKDSKIPAPPNHVPGAVKPLLLAYGLLELHRGASEWSAQGIGNSAAILADSAMRHGFQPVIVEPTGAGGHETSESMLGEMVPLLNGAVIKDDGTWSGRTASIQRVLSRWFNFEDQEWDPA